MKAKKLTDLVTDLHDSIEKMIEIESKGNENIEITVSEANFFSKAVTVKP